MKSEALAGGLQNTNFKVTTAAGASFVVRIPASDAAQHGQDQGVVYANASAAAAAGLGPAPVAFDEATGIIITQFITGTVYGRELCDCDGPSFCGSIHPHTSRAMVQLGPVRMSGADWCLQPGGMPDLRRQAVPAGRGQVRHRPPPSFHR